MGFLQRFLKSTHREGQLPRDESSFMDLSEEQLEAHLGVARYGNFVLTDAVRPSYDLQVVPQAVWTPIEFDFDPALTDPDHFDAQVESIPGSPGVPWTFVAT